MTEFDAADVARDVAELYEPVAEEAGLDTAVEAVALADEGNRELVSQALANLLDNAIKYAAPAGIPVNGAPAEIADRRQGEDDDSIQLRSATRGRAFPKPIANA